MSISIISMVPARRGRIFQAETAKTNAQIATIVLDLIIVILINLIITKTNRSNHYRTSLGDNCFGSQLD